MTTDEIREKYLKFFEKRGHRRIPAAPLVLENDPTTLFTSSGMQPLVPYLKGEPHPEGKRLVNSQPSLRLEDIDEVGDTRHTTFFDMLGNWSLGDYFKKEQLSWFWEFLTKELSLPEEKLYVSVFGGDGNVPRDEETFEIWKSLGVPSARIHFYGVEKNWWSRSGTPDQMPYGEIGGPDSEVFYDFATPHDPKYGEKCHPNCDCGRFLEIGNSVFIQYEKQEDGTLHELKQKNVDFGGGLERLAAAANNDSDIFKTDVFQPILHSIEQEFGVSYGASNEKDKSIRVIADHLRAAVILIAENVLPSNKMQGYVLRRLVRRAAFHARLLGKGNLGNIALPTVTPQTKNVLTEEVLKFSAALDKGMGVLRSALGRGDKINGKFTFDLYQSYGFPLELTIDILEKEGKKFSSQDKKLFSKEFEKHKELSRTAASGMFKGGLVDHSEQVVKLHTATHLLHAALRKVLGDHVSQKGSNITPERLRFDFSHPQKVTETEIEKVEALINEQIEKALPVSFETKTLEEARKEGALAFFGEKYGGKVKVYTVGPATGSGKFLSGWFSREVCGGPHVKNTRGIGRVKITKEEGAGSGVRRVYATIH